MKMYQHMQTYFAMMMLPPVVVYFTGMAIIGKYSAEYAIRKKR